MEKKSLIPESVIKTDKNIKSMRQKINGGKIRRKKSNRL